jgi:required for meiotic nuclear division protein 1
MAIREHEVRAYAIADTLPLRAFVEATFDSKTADVRKTLAVIGGPEEGWVVIHDFGAVVFVDVPESERRRVVAAVERFGKSSQVGAEEKFLVRVDEDDSKAVTFDAVFVRELTKSVVELVALVVGQSVAMEYYEDDVDRILAELDTLAVALEKRGSFSGRLRRLVRAIGRGMHLRNRVVSTLALLDAPDVTWDSEAHDRLYRDLRRAFAIEDRYRALDHKLSIIRDNLELVVDLVRHDRSIVLEAAVFLLIAVEVVMAFVRH